MRRWPLLACLPLAACDLSMQSQDRHAAQSSPTLWTNGVALTPPPEGTVPIDAPAARAAEDQPPHVTIALLQRGRDEHMIFCAPCHGQDGRGDGAIVQRGFPRPPAYREARLRAASPAAIVDVLSNGRGAMYGFADKIAPADRWAIAAYVKTLQRLDKEAAR